MPFCAPKSSPAQIASTPMLTSFTPMATANSLHLSINGSMYSTPWAMSTSSFSRPTSCCIISNIVSSMSPTMK